MAKTEYSKMRSIMAKLENQLTKEKVARRNKKERDRG